MKPDVIMNGNTIMRMTMGTVKFLDSYLFLHMRLANFPKTFGLTEMKKGYFLDPFSESCAIAQACSKVWRKNYMPEDCIAIIPPEGYQYQNNYSVKAVRWIQSEAKKNGVEIRHALNGG